jgi:hypothetical protein
LLNARLSCADSFSPDVQSLIQSSCIDCHDAETDTPLNLEQLDHDLTNRDSFKTWEKVFDRIRLGEMPPASESRPNKDQLAKALA